MNNEYFYKRMVEKIDNYIINKYEYLLDLEPDKTQYNF